MALKNKKTWSIKLRVMIFLTVKIPIQNNFFSLLNYQTWVSQDNFP
jgi:hypothetical protein